MEKPGSSGSSTGSGTSAARVGSGISVVRTTTLATWTGATMGHPRMLNLLTKMTLALFGSSS
ncbi:hypothetical protein E2562_020372 [Oryza meyeriana var. granulata]|uniref:Uncharacterized protein n=1 Tax=Oryza meyeriana var. granulata TaxID=110450 RepID=A0A6G1DLA1_9ORYZ|nr:hypothetical protein E2562_020372 [Oryza meyeriana var. granulata]